ncbi:hypothetical protein Bbelb_227970 [Branchiostoma belcheri]|nr:hypothetical protein Bbelb_227970 [Branchiostoma belcheri]
MASRPRFDERTRAEHEHEMYRSFFAFSLLIAACLAGPVPLNKAEEDAILLLEKKLPKQKPLRTKLQAEKDIMDQILDANNELNLFEGDIPGVSVNTMARNAIRDVTKVWTSRNIPFVIQTTDFSSSELAVIDQAMEEYHLQTCIRFVPRTNEPDYIHIKKLTGCWSAVGVTGGEQEVSFGNGCIHKGIMMHELMHAVGFWHEQSRSDRDDWVVIQWENIQEGKAHNFNKYSQTEVDTLGATYDYGSVMHYSATSFSKSGLPTIVARTPTEEVMGQRNGFSTLDLQKINQLYSCHMPVGWSDWSAWSPCDDTCTKTRRRFCSDPAGCSGHDTETQTCPWPCMAGVHPDCGSSFLGGPSGEIKSPMHPQNYHDFLNCQWLINATGSDPITLSFKEFSVEAGGANCAYDALKVYDGANDKAPLLGTFCGEENPPEFTSSGDRMFITFSTDSSYNQRGFIMEYSSVPLLTDCDFDTDMCTFFQDTSDNFDWTRHEGSTPSGQTGPTADHTSGTGHYLFIEASSPQDVGHNAIIRSQIYPPSSAGYCLDFYYHMYGSMVGDLNVYLFTGVRQEEPTWSMSGNQGNQWLRARVEIKPTSNFQLMFEAVRGGDWRGDIAIDDIKLISHPCQ